MILLQDTTLPTNIWTVGGALLTFASVIAYLFKLFAQSQENRFSEMKVSFEGRLQQVQKDLDQERLSRQLLQGKFEDALSGKFAQSTALLERVEDVLLVVNKKFL